MNILLINRSDSLGGAAKASFRLMNALRRLGHDARMLVLDKSSGLPCVELAAKPWRAKGAFLAERLQILLNNGFSRDTLFQIDTATHGIDISSHPWVRQADVLMLGWVNQGMLSVDGVRRLAALKKPMIWTMHDMWNCTGVCHHAYDCRRYTGRCTACPLTGKQADDISTAAQRRKGEIPVDKVDEHTRGLKRILRLLIGEAVRRGEYREDCNPIRVMHLLYSQFEAVALRLTITGGAELSSSIDQIDAILATLRR